MYDIEQYCDSVTVPVLNVDEADICEGLFSVEECTETVQNLKMNTSPGLDGLSPEFYQTFRDEIKHLVVNSFNHAFVTGQLSISQRRGVLSLIPKTSSLSLNIKDYRPISITCCD